MSRDFHSIRLKTEPERIRVGALCSIDFTDGRSCLLLNGDFGTSPFCWQPLVRRDLICPRRVQLRG
jgi:hypothetical protein